MTYSLSTLAICIPPSLPILFLDISIYRIFFNKNNDFISSIYVSSIPLFDKIIECKHLISYIELSNSLNPDLVNFYYINLNFLFIYLLVLKYHFNK